MGTRTRLAHNFFDAVLGLGLLSLVFLGSPGCGCGDDDLLPPLDRGPEECCCDFEWLPPRIAGGSDVVLSVENADAGLGAVVTPTLFTSVNFTVAEAFTVCVSEEHPLGNQLELVFTDQATNAEYGRAMLQYKTRCNPEIEPLSDGLMLTSTDCGGGEPLTCCCEFEWRPNPNQVGDVELVAQGATAGLNPVITPSAINGVDVDDIVLFEVCVDVDHPLPAQFDLVIRQAGGGAVLGGVQLIYDERCTPTLVPTTAIPALDITSTECGGAPLTCCCTFEWLPPVDYTGNVNITATSASTGLDVVITPSTINGVIPRSVYTFQVCINADHNLDDSFQLVITDTGGGDIGRALISYEFRCDADISDIAGVPNLFLTTTDCGGVPLLCCCDFVWSLGTADSNLTGTNWTATLENVDASLETATVTPTSGTIGTPPWSETFTVCVNPGHITLASLDLVIRVPTTGLELARLPLLYDLPCLPIMGDPSGAGTWTNLCETVDKPGR